MRCVGRCRTGPHRSQVVGVQGGAEFGEKLGERDGTGAELLAHSCPISGCWASRDPQSRLFEELSGRRRAMQRFVTVGPHDRNPPILLVYPASGEDMETGVRLSIWRAAPTPHLELTSDRSDRNGDDRCANLFAHYWQSEQSP